MLVAGAPIEKGRSMSNRFGWSSLRTRHALALAVAFVMTIAIAVGGSTTAAADPLGGPVIIGGDDLTDHGNLDGNGKPAQGWLYIQRALENISPKVTRANDGSVAALGSAPSTFFCCDAGAGIGFAAAEAGLPVTYYNGEDAIRGFFAQLDAGTANPRIIWIAGNGAGNDLASGPGNEPAALVDNATKIGDFVNAGGGLMSHGSEFRWLFGLLPGLTAVCCGWSGDLELTPEGTAAFPGVTNTDVNAGPWHNHFEGNFGGLQVLVKSNVINDANGNDAAVILGGAAVQLPGAITLEPASATNPVGSTHTVTATVRGGDGSPAPGVEVTFSVTAGPNTGETGTATTDADGKASFTYTGDGGPGTDTIEASFVDGSTTRSTTATKTWEAVNQPPDAVDDTLTTDEGTPATINVLANDTDPDGDPLAVTGVTSPQHGSVSCSANGDCTYTPAAGYSGPDSFTYDITDGRGGTDTATVNVTVRSVGEVAGKGSIQTTGFGRLQFEVDASSSGGFFRFATGNANRFESSTIEGFSRTGNAASFNGAGTWNGASGYTYEVSFVDNGTPGRNDTIDVVVRDAGGAVVFSSGGPKSLKTGNIVVSE